MEGGMEKVVPVVHSVMLGIALHVNCTLDHNYCCNWS